MTSWIFEDSDEQWPNKTYRRSLRLYYSNDRCGELISRVRVESSVVDRWRVAVAEALEDESIYSYQRVRVDNFSTLMAVKRADECNRRMLSLEVSSLLELWRSEDSDDWDEAMRSWFDSRMRLAVSPGGDIWKLRNRLIVLDVSRLSRKSNRRCSVNVPDTCDVDTSIIVCEENLPVDDVDEASLDSGDSVPSKELLDESYESCLSDGRMICPIHRDSLPLSCWSVEECKRLGIVNVSDWFSWTEYSRNLGRVVVILLPEDFEPTCICLCSDVLHCVERRRGIELWNPLNCSNDRFTGCRIIRVPHLRNLECDGLDESESVDRYDSMEYNQRRNDIVTMNFMIFDCRTWEYMCGHLDAYCIECLAGDCLYQTYTHYLKHHSFLLRN